MKRLVLLAVAALTLAGCSDNKLTIQNRSAEVDITLNFRAESYFLAGGGSPTNPTILVIDEIPNGSYTYSTVYRPRAANMDVVPGTGLSGTFKFERSATEILLMYGSYSETDSAGITTTTLWGQTSSSDPIGAITAP